MKDLGCPLVSLELAESDVESDINSRRGGPSSKRGKGAVEEKKVSIEAFYDGVNLQHDGRVSYFQLYKLLLFYSHFAFGEDILTGAGFGSGLY